MSKSRNQHVLVIGSGGFIGTHVVESLLSEGYAVRGFDLFIPQDLNSNVDWIVGSVYDEALLASSAQGCDIVMYVAGGGIPASGNANMAAEINSHVRTAVKAAEICRDQGVKTFIFASSGGTVYGSSSDHPLSEDSRTQPLNAYGVSKMAIEHYLRVISELYGLRTISLRISNPYGEGQKADRTQGFVATLMSAVANRTTVPIWGDGSTVRDFIYIKDVAQAFTAACRYDGPSTVINIGSNSGRSLIQLIRMVEDVCKTDIDIAFQPNRQIDVKCNILDISKARTELAWTPATTLEDGLRRTVKWWKLL